MTAPMLYRTASALTLAMAIAAAPALAQETAAPPLVIQPAPAPVPQTATPAPQAATPAPQVAAPAPQAQTAPPVAATTPPAEDTIVADEAVAPAARTRTARPAPRAAARAAPAQTRAATAPAAAAIEPAPAPVAAAPVETAPVDVTPAPVAEAPAPAQQAATTTETATDTAAPTWPWLAGAILLIAAIGAFFMFRRRRTDEDVYYEEQTVAADPVYAEPMAAAMPMAAPIAADRFQDEVVEEQAELVTADADDVAAITASDAPAGRPWIELSFRPVRAGATEDSATVDVELTLGNAGDVAAKNVRVSTFMLGDQADAPTQIERLLATDHTGTDVDAGRIEPGEGSRVDATLSVARDTMSGGTFSPVVVADVRYDLPNGGEGRTAASFVVGATAGDDTLIPFQLGGDVREDVGAALHGELERA